MRIKLMSLLGVAVLALPSWAQALPAPSGFLQPPPAQQLTTQPTPVIPAVPIDGGSCGDNCNERRGYWTVGGGAYIFTPYYSSNPAFLSAKTTGGTTTITQTDFSQKMQAAPLGFLAYTFDNGWGIRFRYFGVDATGHATAAGDGATSFVLPGIPGQSVTLPAGTSITSNSRLRIDAYDLEATNFWLCGRWSILASAGARYVNMDQSFGFSTAPGNLGIDAAGTATISAGNSFSGFGPTMSIDIRRQICDSNFYLYSSARGSILFGNARQTGALNVNGTDTNTLSANETRVISIGELELGTEWACCVGRFRLSAQLGVVGQIWWGAGNPSEVTSLQSGATSPGANLGLVGGVLRAGISF